MNVNHKKEKQRKTILKKKEQAEKIRAEKVKKWAMLRWINSYIEENQEKWDEIDLIHTQENYEKKEFEDEQDMIRAQEKFEQDEKKTRMKIIEAKKRKLKLTPEKKITEQEQENHKKTEITSKQEWRQEPKRPKQQKTLQTSDKEENQHQNKIKLEIKMKQPTLIYLVKNNEIKNPKTIEKTQENPAPPENSTHPIHPSTINKEEKKTSTKLPAVKKTL